MRKNLIRFHRRLNFQILDFMRDLIGIAETRSVTTILNKIFEKNFRF